MNKSLVLEPGKKVSREGKNYRIAEVFNLSKVILVDESTGETLETKAESLLPPLEVEPRKCDEELMLISEEAWETANKRYEVIKPLVNKGGRTRDQVIERAQAHDLHVNTVYLWLRSYEGSGLLTSLLPKTRSDKGAIKGDQIVEEIIKEAIATEYLTKQKKIVRKVIDAVKAQCLKRGLTPPHDNTVRNRVKALPLELVSRKRHGRKKSDNDFKPIEGKFPGADWPLAVVQIDHTKLDIILVDDHYRAPIGRPWITLSFDVFSRLVTGFYISFDPPSAMTTGLCLAHSILPKERWLAKLGVSGEWPVWGLPDKIHADNAKEFRGNMLKRACSQYSMDLEWRPVARPNYGAHVERALGTLSKEVHALPGSTFANPKEKGDYDSEKAAALTLSEFEKWLADYIVNVYHQKKHSMLGMAPLARYKQGILGDSEMPGRGLPAKIIDEEKLKLDLMPFEMRTIQDYGIVVDKIYYYHDVLRPWINAIDPQDTKRKRKFMVRRDPRDISLIWFFDPELKSYYQIPYRDTSHPAISIWELREALKRVEESGGKINEHTIFEAYERMRELEQEAVNKTKAAKRSRQRRKNHTQAEKPNPMPAVQEQPGELAISTLDIEPFDDMDEWS
ncbi:Mu transposase C-terminal domain-containing protein [Pseudoalteromonas sp. MMG022]|uniref:Mu transposase C-terminal domain-containing protein n=1 Tax=Pseudoalteromonas sp. MMG022 TaxID=2909978 RepID=UPI0031BBBD15|nr:Mu transposase C-terminal domain-containing protein [Pseudoalteromonas sp. MMG022]